MATLELTEDEIRLVLDGLDYIRGDYGPGPEEVPLIKALRERLEALLPPPEPMTPEQRAALDAATLAVLEVFEEKNALLEQLTFREGAPPEVFSGFRTSLPVAKWTPLYFFSPKG